MAPTTVRRIASFSEPVVAALANIWRRFSTSSRSTTPTARRIPVIEGEGATDGKIFDDALLIRRNHVVAVADKLNIPTEFLRNQVRVPGGTDHCNPGQNPVGSASLSVAVFYVNSGFDGASISLGPGVYGGKALGEFNNDIESVRVPDGLQVRMCTHSGGSCKRFTEDVRRLPQTYINKVSRVEIERLAG